MTSASIATRTGQANASGRGSGLVAQAARDVSGGALVEPAARFGDISDPMALSMAQFQGWVTELRQSGQAWIRSPRVVSLSEQATRRFCLGMADGRMFFGLQEPELSWFLGIPWLHCAVKRGGSNIAFVSESTQHSGNSAIPSFALSLKVREARFITALLKHHYLDVREVQAGSQGAIYGASRTARATIDIVSVKDDESLNGLMDSRKAIRPALSRRT
jgi:hypothetical protein